MNARQYERYVSEVVSQMEVFSKATITRNKRFDGIRQPGKYEIDISLEFVLANTVRIFVIIECKNVGRPVDRPVVQKLVQTKDAVSAHIAILASPVGFTKEANKVAEALGVTLLTLPWKVDEKTAGARAGGNLETKGSSRSQTSSVINAAGARGPVVQGPVGGDVIDMGTKLQLHLEVGGQFETAEPGYSVRLGVIVTTRMDVESYVNRRENVLELMKEIVVTETRQLLHSIDPERFYLRFRYSNKRSEESVEKILNDRIKAKLVENFNADVIEIVFKVLDTEITERWAELEKSEGSIEIKLPSLSGLEEITLSGTIRVEAIHSTGWNRFRITSPHMNEIIQRIEGHVRAQLGTLSTSDLIYTNLARRRQIESLVERVAKEFAIEELGLVIRLNNIQREFVQYEEGEKTRVHQVISALEELLNQRTAYLKGEASSEKVKAIETQIQRLESGLPDHLRIALQPLFAFDLLNYNGLRASCLEIIGYQPRLLGLRDFESPSFPFENAIRGKGTPVFEISNLVLTYLSQDAGANSIISRWKSDQKKRLEKYRLPDELVESLLQAVVEGDENQYAAIRRQLPQLGPQTDS